MSYTPSLPLACTVEEVARVVRTQCSTTGHLEIWASCFGTSRLWDVGVA